MPIGFIHAQGGLVERSYSDQDILKIWIGNWLRAMNQMYACDS